MNVQNQLNLSDTERIKIEYGISVLIINISKLLIVYTLAILSGHVLEVSIILFVSGFLRIRSFGLHSKKSLNCTISSLVLFNGLALLIKLVAMIHLGIMLIIMLVVEPSISIYIIAGIFVQLGAIAPLTYKLNHRRYRNYEIYN